MTQKSAKNGRAKAILCAASAAAIVGAAAPAYAAHQAAKAQAGANYCCQTSWDCWFITSCVIDNVCSLSWEWYGACS